VVVRCRRRSAASRFAASSAKAASASSTRPTIRSSIAPSPSRSPSSAATASSASSAFCALKVAKLGGDSEQRIKRFLREAKSAANLRHPHIVPLFEFDQDGDQFYLALAYIPGQSLDHVISELNAKKVKMDCRRAATLVRHLAEALAYAHGLGIVHRDIKPHNVMLDERGDPLLMDFGLAAREMDEKLTREGAIMGTAAYLAPEQYRGEPTAASDQYSLGVTLYALLTGETPFAGSPVAPGKQPPYRRGLVPG
jgi:serine/threonine protein kinase